MSSTFTDLTPECPVCDGVTQFLGRLGRLDWWTCRRCGAQVNTPADTDDDREVPAGRRRKPRF